MLLRLTEDNKLVLVEKAFLISTFQEMYDHAESKFGKGMGVSAFIFLHHMYHFDSTSYLKIPDEKTRIAAVKKLTPRGSALNIDRKMRGAMEKYKELYDDEMASMYTTTHMNLIKLRDYSRKMILIPDEEDEVNLTSVLVDSKEFGAVNTLVIKLTAEVEDFKKKMSDEFKSRVDIFGGGEKGLFE